MKGLGLKKSLSSLIVFQLSLTFILVHEKVPSHYIFDIWIFPLALLLVFLWMGVKGTAGELLAGWFFLGLIGFGLSVNVPWIVRPLVLVVSALWFLLCLDLKNVDWTGYLAKVILNLTPWKRRFLVIVTGFSVLVFTFKLLNDSPMSLWAKFFIVLMYLVVFVAFLMLSKKYRDMNSRKGILRFSVLVFIFIGIYVKVRNNMGFILQVIVVPFLWTALLALVEFSNGCSQGRDNGISVRRG
ncbi:hypothetical protein [Thermococcus sp.]|uniref:hypothetical protein n=1 Tax=Thermococcus sp. TaxID=35749 RepID=UPI00261F952C|nr:hypothetical protein [Thermococcus sp.]